ncbi:MAG: glycosyl hydrolase 53 family protein [Ignavibacteriaceae bacterium]
MNNIVWLKYSLIADLILLLTFQSPELRAQFANGADIGWLSEMEDAGRIFNNDDGITKNCMEILKEEGFNALRFRVWVNPSINYCNKQDVAYMSHRADSMGFSVMLDFHFSDTWADPGHQTKPAAWASHSVSQLYTDIYDHVYDVLDTLKSIGVTPKWVQLGNETNNGMLWEDGRASTNMDQFAAMISSGYDAVKAIDSTIQVIVHLSNGHNNDLYRWMFDGLRDNGANWDIIGMSVYPYWAGLSWQEDNALALTNMQDMISRYQTKVMVCEAGYVNNQPVEAYHYLIDLIEKTKSVGGLGVFYWEPECYSWHGYDMGAWDPVTKQPTVALDAFNEPDSSAPVNVTFRLNTSTNWDTLRPDGFAQIRGMVINGSNTLASGEQISLDQNSELIMENINGDYWEKTVQVIAGNEIRYKYWTGHSLNEPTFLRLGWEGNIQPFDSAAITYRKFIAGVSDTVLQIEYYNSSGASVYQYWKPFEHKVDSIAVYFRVNVGGVTTSGRFDPDLNGPVGVRGDPVNNLNILSWSETKVLSREESSVFDGSFWSGVVYYPLNAVGEEQAYKFFIENDTDNGWENNISDRTIIIPSQDTTISWVSFDDRPIIVSVEEEDNVILDFNLNQNYPNPFNPITQINYELKKQIHTKIIVYNSLGEEVNILVNENKNAGNYTVEWDGRDSHNNVLPSGIYLISLITEKNTASIKAILLK